MSQIFFDLVHFPQVSKLQYFANLKDIARTTIAKKRHDFISTLNMIIKSQMRELETYNENINKERKRYRKRTIFISTSSHVKEIAR